MRPPASLGKMADPTGSPPLASWFPATALDSSLPHRTLLEPMNRSRIQVLTANCSRASLHRRMRMGPTKNFDLTLSFNKNRFVTFEAEMSDGPHKSLPMTPGWKRFAERAYMPAFSIEERREAIPAALKGDWREEGMPSFVAKLRETLSDGQTDFFCNQTAKIEGLRKEAAGFPLRYALLDFAIQAVTAGQSGDEALGEATCLALSDRTASHARQVEEHYYRRPGRGRTVDVRGRVENAISGSDIAAVARRLCGIDRNEQSQRLTKQTALDDGVPLK